MEKTSVSIKLRYKLRIHNNEHKHISKSDYDLYASLGVLVIVKVTAKTIIVAVSERCKAKMYNGTKILKPEISTRHTAWQEPPTPEQEKYKIPGNLHLCAEQPAELAFNGRTVAEGISYDLFTLIERELSEEAAQQLRSRLGDAIKNFGQAA